MADNNSSSDEDKPSVRANNYNDYQMTATFNATNRRYSQYEQLEQSTEAIGYRDLYNIQIETKNLHELYTSEKGEQINTSDTEQVCKRVADDLLY